MDFWLFEKKAHSVYRCVCVYDVIVQQPRFYFPLWIKRLNKCMNGTWHLIFTSFMLLKLIDDQWCTFQLIGTPSEADLGFLNENAKRYIRQLPLYCRQSFTEKFPHVHPAAIDLVEKMLTFDPRQRITGKHLFSNSDSRSLFMKSDCSISFLSSASRLFVYDFLVRAFCFFSSSA